MNVLDRDHVNGVVKIPVKVMVNTSSWILMVLLSSVVLVQWLIMVPALRDATNTLKGSTEAIRKQQDDEVQRLKMLDAAHKRQLVNEAELLLKQRENLRLAKELNEQFKGK